MTVKVNSRGQVTIPKFIRDGLGIGPGSQVEFRQIADASVMIQRIDDRQFAKARGSAGPGMTTDELMALLRGKAD
jgi:AbrB family looped-hinge helix DNA binding protein